MCGVVQAVEAGALNSGSNICVALKGSESFELQAQIKLSWPATSISVLPVRGC